MSFGSTKERLPLDLLNFLRGKILGVNPPKDALVCLGLFVAGAIFIALGYAASSYLVILLGSFGGLLWFVAADASWVTVTPEALRRRLDLHANRPLFQRRLIAGGVVLFWFFLVVLFGPSLNEIEVSVSGGASSGALESPLVGALTVVIFLIAFRVGSSTAQEREIEENVFDEWMNRQQAKREKSKRSFRRAKRDQDDASGEDDGLPPLPPGYSD